MNSFVDFFVQIYLATRCFHLDMARSVCPLNIPDIQFDVVLTFYLLKSKTLTERRQLCPILTFLIIVGFSPNILVYCFRLKPDVASLMDLQ